MDGKKTKIGFKRGGLAENLLYLLVFGLFLMVSVKVSLIYAMEPADKSDIVNFNANNFVTNTSIADRQNIGETFVDNLKHELRVLEKDLVDVSNSTFDVEGRIGTVHAMAETLKEQLDNLDAQIENTTSLINNVAVQINEKETSLMILYDDMEEKSISLENQKKMLMDYLKIVYQQENAITDTTSDTTEISIAKLLLSDGSIGDMLTEVRYLNILEKQGHEIFDRLEALFDEMKDDERVLNAEKAKLALLRMRLGEEKHSLDIQKAAKSALLKQTKGEETIYRELLEQNILEQNELEENIRVLRDSLDFLEKERRRLGDSFDPMAYNGLLSAEKTSVYEYINATKDDGSDFIMEWPVPFEKGISAYFRDPSYVAVFGVRHNAIDVRVPQETRIKAPADGVVYQVKDSGMGYSYLMIAHKGGFMTVFGHVSEFFVDPGEKVYEGQTVALSGGMPGTKGAGLMTTGPHLHFELLKGGKYVDPLYYLPLDHLPMEGLPEKYSDPDFRKAQKIRRILSEKEPTI